MHAHRLFLLSVLLCLRSAVSASVIAIGFNNTSLDDSAGGSGYFWNGFYNTTSPGGALLDVNGDPTGITITNQNAGGFLGFGRGETIDTVVNGHNAPAAPKIRIPPLGVVEQASTGFPVDADPHLRAAIELIDRHGGIGIQVDDVVNASGIGRRSLEVRFRDGLGSSIDARLRQRRIERSAGWLRTTHLQVQEIASQAGFRDVYHFSAAFKKATGLSPSLFRRHHQSVGHLNA